MTSKQNPVDLMRMSRGTWVPELKDKVAIVTGAGRHQGVGRAIALELARQGTKVVITSTGRDPSTFPDSEKSIGWNDIASLAQEIKVLGSEALPLTVDLSEPSSAANLVQRALDRFGRIDVLINNAGAAKRRDRVPIVELEPSEWMRVLDINLNAVFSLSQAVGQQLVSQGQGGVMINISSIASKAADARYGAYAASKAGLNALTHVMAMELASVGVRVNALCPGVLDTSRTEDHRLSGRWEFLLSRIPLGRAGTGMDVAYLCVFLCSDMAAWITGQTIVVDGGQI